MYRVFRYVVQSRIVGAKALSSSIDTTEMEYFDPDQDSIRPRLSNIEKEEDILREQEEFLKNLNQGNQPRTNNPSGNPPHTFTPDYGDETPTSVTLPPIQEKKVKARRRRRTKATSGTNCSFPPIPHNIESFNNVAISSVQQSHKSVVSQAPSEDAQSLMSNMSEEDIYASQAELLQKLSPETVQFLQNKWQQRGLGKFSNDVDVVSNLPRGPMPDEQERTLTSSLASTKISAVEEQGRMSSNLLKDDLPVQKAGKPTDEKPPRYPEVIIDVDAKQHATDIRDSLLIRKGQLDEKEAEKMMWATDSTVEVPSEANLNSILHLSIDKLGDIASKRFDLSGRILSDAEIESLPTHMALHHHGSSPGSAGYTLSDILTLLRSSVMTQRVMALQMFTALIREHGPCVANPLAQSGGLALAFAPFPSPRSFYAAVTCQLAYVDAVQALVSLRHEEEMPQKHFMLLDDLFFASPFYSPVHPQTHRYDAVLDVLSKTDCVNTLMRIAFLNSLSLSVSTPLVEKGPGNHFAVALSALNVIRDLVTYNYESCHAIVNHKVTLNMLTVMAAPRRGADSAQSSDLTGSISLVACDIMAQLFVRVSWASSRTEDEKSGISSIKKVGSWLDSDFLQSMSNHLSILLSDNYNNCIDDASPDSAHPYSALLSNALGALRMFRAALAFQLGVIPFSAVAPAVCKLLYEQNPQVVSEAYLALEGYVHCLHECVALRAQQDNMKATPKEQPEDKHRSGLKRGDHHHHQNRSALDNLPTTSFIQDELSNLVPAALAAVKVFAGSNRALDQVRATAGHFAASLFMVYRIPFPHEMFTLILSVCSHCSVSLISMISSSSVSPSHLGSKLNEDVLLRLSRAASLCHAGARLLTRIKLEPGYVKREVTALLQAVERERDIINGLGGVRWRPVANACAEWIGLYGRTKLGDEPMSLAVQLLPFLSDTQVMMDLLSRSVLNVECLHAVEKTPLSIDDARSVVQALIPVTYEGLCKRFAMDDTDEDVVGRGKLESGDDREPETHQHIIASMFEIMDIWADEKDYWEPLTTLLAVFLNNQLLCGLRCLNFLLCTTPKFHDQNENWANACNLLLDSCKAAASQEGRLVIDSNETILSTSSTTPDPKLAEAVLALADQLVSRGPLSGAGEYCNDETGSPDSLSSVILSLMFCHQVDISLRSTLWEKTVVSCGGGLLYSCAEFVSSTEDEDEESFLCLLVRAIGKCFLESRRCPPILAKIVINRIEKAFKEGAERESIRLLQQLWKNADSDVSVRLSDSFKFLSQFTEDECLVNRILS